MLKVLSNILCDLDPKVKVIGQKAGICDGVPLTSALVTYIYILYYQSSINFLFSLYLAGFPYILDYIRHNGGFRIAKIPNFRA